MRLICVLSYSSLVSSSRILASWRHTRDFSTMDCSWKSSWLCSEWSWRRHTRTHVNTNAPSLGTSADPLDLSVFTLSLSHKMLRATCKTKLIFTVTTFFAKRLSILGETCIQHEWWTQDELPESYRSHSNVPGFGNEHAFIQSTFVPSELLMTDKKRKDTSQKMVRKAVPNWGLASEFPFWND